MCFQNSGVDSSVAIDFPVAGTYRLSFWYKGRDDADWYTPHYRAVKLGTVQLLTYTATYNNGAWSQITKDFTVSAPGTQRVYFCMDTTKTGAGDPCSCIDDVSCTLVTPAQTVTDCASWRQVKAVIDAGGSVRLTRDVVSTEHEQLNNSQKVTVDLNGHKITASSRVLT